MAELTKKTWKAEEKTRSNQHHFFFNLSHFKNYLFLMEGIIAL